MAPRRKTARGTEAPAWPGTSFPELSQGEDNATEAADDIGSLF
jgi:hypothetical protein